MRDVVDYVDKIRYTFSQQNQYMKDMEYAQAGTVGRTRHASPCDRQGD